MRQKYCTLNNKVVYAKVCLECGNLVEVCDVKTKESKWYCPSLNEKVTFLGSHTNKWRKRFNQNPENLRVGEMEPYMYNRFEIAAYSEVRL